MEAQLREELEVEYQNRQQQQGNMNGVTNELESQLRKQLMQVTEERQKWQSDQEEINKKLLNSQHQFEKVREGFKSTYISCVLCLPIFCFCCCLHVHNKLNTLFPHPIPHYRET